MCMKYVNANVQCFNNKLSQIIWGGGMVSSFIDKVQCSKLENGRYDVDRFGIALFINIRGNENDTANNPLEQGKCLDIKVRLTRLSRDENEQFSYDLKEFAIDLSDKSIIQQVCFDMVDLVKIIDVDKLDVKSPGNYVIKVLIKERDAEVYTIQMAHKISLEEK